MGRRKPNFIIIGAAKSATTTLTAILPRHPDIFISKMEQLQKYELKQKREEKKILRQMQSTFVNSQRPLKDLLFYYNKAAEKGFDSSLVANTLE